MSDDFMLQASFTIPSGEQYEKGDMVNVRGRTPEEFHHNLIAFQQNIAEIVARAGMELRAHALAVRGLGGQTIATEHHPQGGYAQQSQPQGQQWQAPQGGGQGGPPQWATGQQGSPQSGYQQQPQQAPASNGIPTEPPPHVGPPPSCSHGVKRFLAKPYKNGKPGYWMGWACPAQRNDPSQHELEFIRQS